MIEGAFTYPTDRNDWLVTVLIGGVLLFLGFLLVPLFAAYGYVVRAIRTTIEGEAEPPAFEQWGDLIVDGIQMAVILVVYQIIPTIVAAVTVGGSLVAIATGEEAGVGAGIAGLFGGLALTGVLALLFGYVSVAAIVAFAREDRFGAAFDPDGVGSLALNAEFAVAWIVSVVVFLVVSVVTGVPVVGWLVAPFLTFYASVVAARLWGGGYLDAVGGQAGSATDTA